MICTNIICSKIMWTKTIYTKIVCTKAELLQEGILFRTQFPSLGIFINKKVGFLKTYDHLVYNL